MSKAEIEICDRCMLVVKPEKGFWFQSRGFFGFIPRKPKDGSWFNHARQVDLCGDCTLEFFTYIKGEHIWQVRKQGESKQPSRTKKIKAPISTKSSDVRAVALRAKQVASERARKAEKEHASSEQ